MLWRKKKAAEEQQQQAERDISIRKADDGAFIMTAPVKLTEASWKKMEDCAEELVQDATDVKVLFDIVQLQAWSGQRGDGNVDFLLKHDPQIARIAVVGDPKWEERVLLFLGAGYRKAKIQFFAADQMLKARQWLRS